jgi:ubiquinone/menaquinone biosynthesis C-methylase UbiE
VSTGIDISVTGSQDQLACDVQTAYARRELSVPPGRYSRFTARELCGLHEREFTFIKLLQRVGVSSLKGKRVLDVGCGNGAGLRQLLEYDTQPANLFGIDLLTDRVEKAHTLSPSMNLLRGNATAIPFASQTFDIVIQFTTFTSVLNAESRMRLADEILRVLVPHGILLWYDLAFDNPRNPDVKGISPSQVRRLFSGCRVTGSRITLAPPIGRTIAQISYPLYHVLAQIRPLCTHYACVIRKPI